MTDMYTAQPEAQATLRFSLFSDMHYKKGMYPATVEDMQCILRRADADSCELVIHCGDLCNDYLGSPELIHALLNNPYGLPVYGLYGNHELESKDNSMETVTPLLTNRPAAVRWGSEDGRLHAEIGYYFLDTKGFRLIFLDSNYSLQPESGVWEHNRTASYGAPAANLHPHSLGDRQIRWLEETLEEAAAQKLHCLILTHAGMNRDWPGASPDADTVHGMLCRINRRRRGTVLMCINGHQHADYSATRDGIVYLNCNAVRNIHWQSQAVPHYTDQTCKREIFDTNLTPIGFERIPLSSLRMSAHSWYSEDPLSATVTVSSSGKITVEGCCSRFIDDIRPDAAGCADSIADGEYTASV